MNVLYSAEQKGRPLGSQAIINSNKLRLPKCISSVLGDPFIGRFVCPVHKGCPESQLCEEDDQEDNPGEESEQAGESKLIQQDRLQLGQQEG